MENDKEKKRGRPKKYLNPEESEKARKNYNKKFYDNQKDKVKNLEKLLKEKDEQLDQLKKKIQELSSLVDCTDLNLPCVVDK